MGPRRDRSTTFGHTANAMPWPVLEQVVLKYPDIPVALGIENRLSGIALDRLDVGIHPRRALAPDIIAVTMGLERRMADIVLNACA